MPRWKRAPTPEEQKLLNTVKRISKTQLDYMTKLHSLGGKGRYEYVQGIAGPYARATMHKLKLIRGVDHKHVALTPFGRDVLLKIRPELADLGLTPQLDVA